MITNDGALFGVQPAGAASSVPFPFAVPNLPQLAGVFVYLQAGALPASGGLRLGSGGFLRLQ